MNVDVIERYKEDRLIELEKEVRHLSSMYKGLEQRFEELERQLEIGSSEPKVFTIEVE